MAFVIKKLNDLSGILFLMFLVLPLTASTSIDCNGKPFHCVNSTHFMICVDLGSGVSGTLDDFVIPCPPTTVCLDTNRFECEFPTVPTQAPQPLETITIQTTTIYSEVSQNIDVNSQATIISSETVTTPFEDYYNTLSSTTLSHNEVSPVISVATTDSSVTDVFEILNNATFVNHENLETAGSGATKVFTTVPHITQTELFNLSTNAPETATLQTLAMATDFTTVETTASTNLDTVTTPTNDITTNKLDITKVSYSTSVTIEGPQTTQDGNQTNVLLSTQPSASVQLINTTQDTTSTVSNYENQIINDHVTTEMNLAVTNVLDTVSSTQINEITQTAALAINDTYLTSTAIITEPVIDLTTEVLVSSTQIGIHNISVPKIPNVVIETTAKPIATAGFENIIKENIVNVQFNKTEQSTVPTPVESTVTVQKINKVNMSTLSPITDIAATMIDTVIPTDEITSNSPLSTTEGYISTVPNILTVTTINLSNTLVTEEVGLTSVPTTESVLTTSGLTTLIEEVPATGSNTIYDTSVSTKSSMDVIESSTATYEITDTHKNKIAFKSSSTYDTNNVTQTTAPVVTDTNIVFTLNNAISNNENQVKNEALLVVDASTPIEHTAINENSNSVLLNAFTESLLTETTQHPSLEEVYSTPSIPVATSQPISVQSAVSIDGSKQGLPTTKSVHFGDGSVTNIKHKPEFNEAITQSAKEEILTTMSLKKSADKPLELTTATNIVNSETITNTESSITSQPSTSVITLVASHINNNSTSQDFISQNTSKITISDKGQQTEFSTTAVQESVHSLKTENKDTYTTVVTTVKNPQSPEIQVITESSTSTNTTSFDSSRSIDNSSIPSITIAIPSADKTSRTESSLTVTSYTPTHTVQKVLTSSYDQITKNPTTVPVTNNQNKIIIENDNDDVVRPLNIDNQINILGADKTVDNKSYNTIQATHSITNYANNAVEQDIRIMPSQETNSVRLDSVSPMTNSETLSYITKPVHSHTVASPMITVSKISDDPLSVNVLDNKYQNTIVRDNSDSTPLSIRVESTPSFQDNDFKIATEPASVNEMISTTISEQQLNVDNSVTSVIDQSNKATNNIWNISSKSINEILLENTASPANNIDVVSNFNTVIPTEIAQPRIMVLPSKQDDSLRTNTKYDITKGAEEKQKQFDAEHSNNPVLSPVINNQDVDDKLNNEKVFFTNKAINVQPDDSASSLSVKVEPVNTSTLSYNGTGSIPFVQTTKINEPTTNKTTETQVETGRFNTYKNYSTPNIGSKETIPNSSNVIKPPDITSPKADIIDSKTLVGSARVNSTTSSHIPSANISANKVTITNIVDSSALRGDQRDIAEKNISSKTPRNVASQFSQTTHNIIMVASSNSPTETTHFSIVSIPPKHQDNILKTNTKYIIYNDDENSVKKPKEEVSDKEQDKQHTAGQINNEKKFTDNKRKTTNINSNSNWVTVLTTASSVKLKIDDEEETEFTKGNINELSEPSYSPNVFGDNVEQSRPAVSARVEPAEAAESDTNSIPQLSKREQLSTPSSSRSYTTQANVTPKTIINSTSRLIATTANAVVKPFLCNPFLRGRFADNHDCRKFYICIGWPLPMTGVCPINTVFSEIRKQCTNNLSHCIRNNQFQCVSEGRFSDFLNDNIYYICMRNKLNHFIRFKLRCQNGYHLDKTSVRCVLNTETSQSISISDKSISDQSGPLARLEKKPGSSDFECDKEGKFADPSDCRTYYICKIRSDSEFKRKKKKCDSDEYFHNDKKKCVDAESYECNI